MIEFTPDEPVTIPSRGKRPPQKHVFDEESKWAIRGALSACRPLLVRGEPGVGKTQLARAAAVALKWPIVEMTVDSRTESRDLLWTLDNVARLAEAQISSAFPNEDIDTRLNILRFVQPGPIWWAFNWENAESHAKDPSHSSRTISETPTGWDSKQDGVVLLIDEIDKGETDVPNGLLEALGSTTFPHPDPQSTEKISMQGQMPLVIITTNEERALPDAFIRRCLVLHIALPDDESELKELLKARGRAHFTDQEISDDILLDAIEMLVDDRKKAKANHITPLPGQAELIDLLNAVKQLPSRTTKKNTATKKEAIEKLRAFVFQKQSDQRP